MNHFSIKNDGHFLLYPFFLLLPFMQMGISYYLSVQTLLLAYLVYHLSLKDFLQQSVALYLLFLAMVVPAFLYTVGNQFHVILWGFRLFVCVMILMAVFVNRSRVKVSVPDIEKNILRFITLLCLFSFVQFVGIKVGHPLSLPSGLFVANAGTMEGFEKAASFGLFSLLRPSACYGEPSYLSFIVTTLLFMALSVLQNKRSIAIVIALSLLTCAFSQSLSGIMALMILLFVYYSKGNIQLFSLVLVAGFVLTTVLLIFSDQLWFMQRLLNIGSGESSMIRLIYPFALISYTFDHYVFGMSQDILQQEFPAGALGTDNGFLNMFINFGISGVLIWGVLLFRLRSNFLAMIYIVLCSMFNGSFLAFDKIAVIGFCFLIINAAVQHNAHKCVGVSSGKGRPIHKGVRR